MDDYVEVSLKIMQVFHKSIRVVGPDGGSVFVGRSCIYGPDEQKLDQMSFPQEVNLRMFRWLAKKESLI